MSDISSVLPKYQQLAGFLSELVDRGTLAPGMRAPSLRSLARTHTTSLSTALQAYRLLEDRGVLEARPRSGYYVARHGAARLEVPAVSRPPRRPARVAVAGGALALLEHAANPALVPLGCAIPDAQLLAAGRLDRFMARVARTRGSEYNTYGAPRGDARLRAEIARRALRLGHVLDVEEMAITCGCTEALSLALGAVVPAGGTVAIESPSYFGLLQVLEQRGLKALELPTDPERGIDLDALAEVVAGGRVDACLLASSFHNPLGFEMREVDKRRVLDILRTHQVPLIEDDVYGDIHFGEQRPRPFAALDPQADVITCASFSKTVAPGYRVGWVASRRHLPRMLAVKAAITLAAPTLAQAALAEYLSSGGYDAHLRRLRRLLSDNVSRMRLAVERSFPAGTRITRPSGGFVLWVELPGEVLARELFERALARGICVAPGEVFTATRRYGNCVRLSCGHAWDARIEGAIATLGVLVADAL